MVHNKIIQKIIFDAILVAIIFLPLFTIIFLWNIFFNTAKDFQVSVPPKPKFDDARFTQIKSMIGNRHHFSRLKTIDLKDDSFGHQDPFNP